jgi:DNA-binding NarL/FixJ family response regulator
MLPSSAPIRVILADDHAVVRAGIRQFLEIGENIQVIAEVDNGQEACKLIEHYQPDVAVLDLQMPIMSGIEVARWVRSHHPQTAILILTAFDDDPFITAALQAGANGYMLKTASPQEIIQAVQEVHAGNPALAPAVAQRLIDLMGQRQASQPVEQLTGREMEVLSLAGRGQTNKAIAHELGISDRTVQNHLARIYEKLQAASRTEAVMRAVSLGWLPATLGEIPE